jgi:hypothetical protein
LRSQVFVGRQSITVSIEIWSVLLWLSSHKVRTWWIDNA